jgi:hypothetical protein
MRYEEEEPKRITEPDDARAEYDKPRGTEDPGSSPSINPGAAGVPPPRGGGDDSPPALPER